MLILCSKSDAFWYDFVLCRVDTEEEAFFEMRRFLEVNHIESDTTIIIPKSPYDYTISPYGVEKSIIPVRDYKKVLMGNIQFELVKNDKDFQFFEPYRLSLPKSYIEAYQSDLKKRKKKEGKT